MDTKKCKKCGKTKQLSEFYKSTETKDGYRGNCKICMIERQKCWNADNKERKREYNKRWYTNNKKHQLERTKQWKINNPDKCVSYKANRRAMKHALPYTTSADVWLDVIATYKYRCAVTGKDKFDLEHFIPISWGYGGSLKDNIYPMDSSLNSSKSNKNPFKWMKQLKGQQRANFEQVIHNLAKENGLTYKEFHKYVNWCEKNKRSLEQVLEDNEKGLTGIDLWRQATQNI